MDKLAINLSKRQILIIAVGMIAIVGLLAWFWPSTTTIEQKGVQMKVKEVKIGQGPEALDGNEVTIHYKGELSDGTTFVDSKTSGLDAFKFRSGDGRTILGWQLGVKGMREGGIRRLTIPPPLAYGESGVQGIVPPNATVIYEIELIKISP